MYSSKYVELLIEEKENLALTLDELGKAFGRAGRAASSSGTQRSVSARPAEGDVKPMIEHAIRWFEGDIIERRGNADERTVR